MWLRLPVWVKVSGYCRYQRKQKCYFLIYMYVVVLYNVKIIYLMFSVSNTENLNPCYCAGLMGGSGQGRADGRKWAVLG